MTTNPADNPGNADVAFHGFHVGKCRKVGRRAIHSLSRRPVAIIASGLDLLARIALRQECGGSQLLAGRLAGESAYEPARKLWIPLDRHGSRSQQPNAPPCWRSAVSRLASLWWAFSHCSASFPIPPRNHSQCFDPHHSDCTTPNCHRSAQTARSGNADSSQ